MDFEVHGGGSDLVFPHHENEIAQTEAARGKPLARVWMHNGMVEMGAEKMAKSVGNIRLLHGALDEYGPEAILMWLVSAHYRKPIGFSEEALAQARGRTCARSASWSAASTPTGRRRGGMDALAERFFDALADDFNTPEARAVLFEWVARGQSPPRRRRARSGPGACARCCTRFGLERLVDEADEEAPDGGARAGRAARGGPRGARLRRGGPAAGRAGGARLGGPRHAGRRPARPLAR